MTDWLDNLERPVRRKRKRVGKAKDADGRSEREIQRGIVKDLRRMGYIVTHVPMGELLQRGSPEARMRRAARMEADGCVFGWPDLLIFRSRKRGGPEWGLLEIKRPGQALEPRQKGLADMLAEHGAKVGAACCSDTMVETLRRWQWL